MVGSVRLGCRKYKGSDVCSSKGEQSVPESFVTGSTILALLVSALSAWFQSRAVVGPLSQLEAQMRVAAEGDCQGGSQVS